MRVGREWYIHHDDDDDAQVSEWMSATVLPERLFRGHAV